MFEDFKNLIKAVSRGFDVVLIRNFFEGQTELIGRLVDQSRLVFERYWFNGRVSSPQNVVGGNMAKTK